MQSGSKLWLRGQNKPVGVPRINWRHPLSRGLVFYGFDIGGQIFDLVGNRPPTYFGSPIGGVAANGTGINWNGSSQSAYFAADVFTRITQPYTTACAFYQVGPSQLNCGIFNRTANNAASQPFSNWMIAVNAPDLPGDAVLSAWCNDGGNFRAILASSYAIKNFTSAAIVAAGTDAIFYINGVTFSAQGGISFATTNTQDAICFSGRSNVSASQLFNGYIFYGGLWNRALSDNEVSNLHLDPYCFLTMSIRPLGFTKKPVSQVVFAKSIVRQSIINTEVEQQRSNTTVNTTIRAVSKVK